jgi:hypothetical protein
MGVKSSRETLKLVISHIYQEIDQLPEKQSDRLYRLA